MDAKGALETVATAPSDKLWTEGTAVKDLLLLTTQPNAQRPHARQHGYDMDTACAARVSMTMCHKYSVRPSDHMFGGHKQQGIHLGETTNCIRPKVPPSFV